MAASDVLARVADIAADTAEALVAADEQQGSSQGSDGGHPPSHEAVLTTALAQLRKEKALDLVGWSRERGENHALLTALDVTRFLARADGSLAQIPQSHFVFSRYLAQSSVLGIEEKLIANAQVGAPHVGVRRKTVRGEQREVLSGSKRFLYWIDLRTGSCCRRRTGTMAAGQRARPRGFYSIRRAGSTYTRRLGGHRAIFHRQWNRDL